jgi:hypothetical protein
MRSTIARFPLHRYHGLTNESFCGAQPTQKLC